MDASLPTTNRVYGFHQILFYYTVMERKKHPCTLLVVSCVVVLCLFSGCVESPSPTPAEEHEIEASTFLNEPITTDVTIENSGGETLFNHRYQLPPNTYDESKSFTGTPDRIRRSIDTRTRTVAYDPPNCPSSNIPTIVVGATAKATLKIVYRC
jgi:hypothetical protein